MLPCLNICGAGYISLSAGPQIESQQQESEITRTFATDDGPDFCPAPWLRCLFDPLERYAVTIWLLDPDIAVFVHVERVERAHLNVKRKT